ncbi:acyl-CoA synthetase [Pseudooceanicola sp. HF7]|uniref:acyl-CoA synthetase n=1 Tax=Pseudooceanicola sp. HF7 TaxID=2721560 RepID=UPI0014316D47|nr:acyl-CoA synthetase [Pseudooceanicola sp. HF7]NIZ07918.1 acyl-CoA synthetase [Pseudooceanicola sp. HF7]
MGGENLAYTGVEGAKRLTNEMPWEARDVPKTVFEMISRTATAFPERNAISFQLESGPGDRAETLSWRQFQGQVAQAANMFRAMGVGADDVVALVLPNCLETAVVTLGGMVAGIVNPINPLLEAEQIASILRETGAKVVVTLKSFPKSDVAQKTAEAVRHAPACHTVLEIDLNRYLGPPKSWLVPLLRPKMPARCHADVKPLLAEMAKYPTTLQFDDRPEDRVAAYFHTGGTTGMPKVARHLVSGIVYNGWLGATLLFREDDSIMCPLPMFHVFACQVMLIGAATSGAHIVFPTPAGYRGDGVFDNFWKLCERWKSTFIIGVPTAFSALMQRPVDADLSTVKLAFSGSAALPQELFKRFEKAAGVKILEGYGLTEATCLVSCNPDQGERKYGSVGVPFPYTEVRILDNSQGEVRECGPDEVGEICIASPGVYPGSTYTEAAKNADLFHYDRYLRTGDLGRLDEEGYLFITGRAKDLIIRGGHNIDPAVIEDALASHRDVAFAGAIGQPDARAGELPCVYVELVAGATADAEELMAHCKVHVHERAAIPKHVEILDELPKTAVGKVFKPDLRKLAIKRVYDAALADAGVAAEVTEVVDDRKRGLTARLRRTGEVDQEKLRHVLGNFTRPWEWAEATEAA